MATTPTERLYRTASAKVFVHHRASSNSRNDDLVGTPRVVRASPDNSQNHSGSASNNQNVTDKIHLLDPGSQVVLGGLDIQKRPDETESEQAEGKVDEE